jgi:hypothetical protein
MRRCSDRCRMPRLFSRLGARSITPSGRIRAWAGSRQRPTLLAWRHRIRNGTWRVKHIIGRVGYRTGIHLGDGLIEGLKLGNGIRELRTRAPGADNDDSARPIFILAAGWRSGSTVLQRLVISSGTTMIWGEPYAPAGLFPAMCMSLTRFRPGWPNESDFQGCLDAGELQRSWIANMYPPISSLRNAHRAFLCELFEAPAHEAGYSRWGIKEVRLDFDYASYLHWLFPRAKFLFLCRNPYHAYRSYRSFLVKGRVWYKSWPDEPIRTPEQFGAHWSALTRSFLAGVDTVSGRFIRYEELHPDSMGLASLEEFLQLRLNVEVLKKRLSGSSAVTNAGVLPFAEQELLARVVEPLASGMGYRPTPA